MVKGTVDGVKGLRFNSRACEIGPTSVTAAMFLRSCVVQALSQGDKPRYMLQRNTASVVKI